MPRARKYKTIIPRVAASLIDGVVFLPISFFENKLIDTDDKTRFIVNTLLFSLLWVGYRVYMHGRYGQTLGKMASNVKLYDAQDEKKPIGFSKAFMRELPGLSIIVFDLGYLFVNGAATNEFGEFVKASYSQLVYYTAGIFSLMEFLCVLLHRKRRSLHDLFAGTIVLDVAKYTKWDFEYDEQQAEEQ